MVHCCADHDCSMKQYEGNLHCDPEQGEGVEQEIGESGGWGSGFSKHGHDGKEGLRM